MNVSKDSLSFSIMKRQFSNELQGNDSISRNALMSEKGLPKYLSAKSPLSVENPSGKKSILYSNVLLRLCRSKSSNADINSLFRK